MDPANGTSTLAAFLTFPASIVENFNRVNAMDFQPGTGVLFGSVNSGGANYLGTIDMATGIVSLFDTGGGPTQTQYGLDAIAFSPAGGAGVPATIAITAGGSGSQSTFIHTAFPLPLQATVQDSGGNPVAGVTVTFTAPTSGASGTFAGGGTSVGVTTDSSGVATSAAFTANSASGSYPVNATVPGVATPATFALANLDISVASATGTQTVAAGGTANYTLNFTAIVDKSVNPTTFACQNLPAAAACAFNPTSLPADSPNTPFGLGISTTARTAAASVSSGGGFGVPLGILPATVLALLAMIAMSLASFSKRAPRFAPSRVAAFGLLVLMVGYIAGCGG